MTGLRSGDAVCDTCGARLCLGPTLRVVAYSTMIAMAGLMGLCIWLIGDITYVKLLSLMIVPVSVVIPLSLWMAFRVPGVMISPRNTHAEG